MQSCAPATCNQHTEDDKPRQGRKRVAEGDSDVAAENAALRIGSAIQRQRIAQLVEAILADAQSDDDAKVTRILAEVAKLTEDPDPEMIEKVRHRFPGVSDRSIQAVARYLKSAMNGAKQSMTAGLKEFDRGKANQRNLTLALWWAIQRKP